MRDEIILVDDDEVLLVILRKMFHKVSPDTDLILFNSGRDALTHIAHSPVSGRSRYLLLDINLKDLSGWDILNELVERNDESTKIFLITSSVSSSNAIMAKKYKQVLGFFEKPITLDKIRQILKQIQEE
jgi:DNA-binding NtrC family response regulator